MVKNLKVNASRAAKLPAREIFSKGMVYVQRRIQQKVNKRRYMQQYAAHQTPLLSVCQHASKLFAFDAHVINGISAQLYENAQHILDHNFALFNTARLKNHFDSLTDAALDSRIHKKHLQNAQKVFSQISGNYKPIDWQRDIKSGYRWSEKTWYQDIALLADGGADIKVPWELARMQHLPQLALACAAENSEMKKSEYKREFENQILDFVATNPQYFGANWHCAMEVAIRAANWIVAFYLFRSGGVQFEENFENSLAKSLYAHGQFILNNLERTSKFANNHYMANVAGLLFIALFFDRSGETSDWYEFAVDELKTEIHHQFYDDGTNFEASTTYHKLSLELVFYSMLFAVKHADAFDGRNGAETANSVFGADFVQKLREIFASTVHLIKPDGYLPQIGDNDSGQFFQLTQHSSRDATLLLAHGALFFNNQQWFDGIKSDDALHLELALFYGSANAKKFLRSRDAKKSELPSRIFSDSGWAVLRAANSYCFLIAGKNGQDGVGGHSHNDKLSIVLSWNGQDMIRDAGTYVYTAFPEQRNRFRSTAFHNTVTVDGQEQNQIVYGELFKLADQAQAKIVRHRCGKNLDVVVAEHSGYTRLKEPVLHRRTILFYKKKNYLKIVDSFTGEGDHTFKFNLNPTQDFFECGTVQSNLKWRQMPGELSLDYGEKKQTQRLEAEIRATVPCRFYTALVEKTGRLS